MTERPSKCIITKPHTQVANWRASIVAAGWEVISIPLLTLETRPETPEQRESWQHLDQFSGVIAISPTAAQWCVHMLDTWWPQAPLGVLWFGAGPGTASAFAQNHLGITMNFPPQGFRAEDLLKLPQLQQVAHQRWLIIAGVGGRTALADTLSQRGATVTRLAVYERHPTTLNDAQLNTLRQLRSRQDIVHISSQRALESLTSQLSAATTQDIDLLVSSPRLQEWAYRLGWQRVWLATGASLEATLTALTQYRNSA